MISLLSQTLLRERERFLLWLPVGLAAGMLGYFSLHNEPPFYVFLPVMLVPLLLWRAGRRWPMSRTVAIILSVIAIGMVAAKIGMVLRPVTMLSHELNFVKLHGRIIEIGDVEGGLRLTLDRVVLEGVSPDETPERVRVKYRGDPQGLLTGDEVELRAGLLPPAGPVMEGAFDFARYFYCMGIGGVGYAIPPLKVVQHAGPNPPFSVWLGAVRQHLSERIRNQMPPVEGAITAALMMGDRAAIPDDVNQDMRNSGLTHILSISGLHMVIVCGLVFLVVRYALLLPRHTRHLRQGKKIAALAALLVGAAYLMISGLPPSAVRSYIMVAFVFGAVLLDREVVPMRSLALAATAMLLWWPAQLLDPGFQLSFMATAALIAWYEWIRSRADITPEAEQWPRRLMLYVGATLMTSVVAESVTLPLVIHHFNSVSLYGMLANLLISPVVTFLIMPFIILAFVLMPLSLEWVALLPVEYGVHAMVLVARWVSAIPYSQFYVRAQPGWGTALMVLGLLWIIIWQKRLRVWGVVAIIAGIFSVLTIHPADVLMSYDAKQIAARVDGYFVLLRGRPTSFIPQQWANLDGETELPVIAKTNPVWRCDTVGCVLTLDKTRLAFSLHQASLKDDCVLSQGVIAPYKIERSFCRNPRQVIDYDSLKAGGSHWLWLDHGRLELGNTRAIVGNRPWSR